MHRFVNRVQLWIAKEACLKSSIYLCIFRYFHVLARNDNRIGLKAIRNSWCIASTNLQGHKKSLEWFIVLEVELYTEVVFSKLNTAS